MAVFFSPNITTPADASDRVTQATDVILALCLASSSENISVSRTGDSLSVGGDSKSLSIRRSEYRGIVGGISKELTQLSSQQASEARACTERHLSEVLTLILRDQPVEPTENRQKTGDDSFSVERTPDLFWGGGGIWADNRNFCHDLRDFIVNAADDPSKFVLATGRRVSQSSLNKLTDTAEQLEGNYFIKTEKSLPRLHFCRVYRVENKNGAYNGVTCGRTVSYGNPGVFASVYNQTLKDMRDCLGSSGWTQSTVDQGACIPSGTGRGECIRRFDKGSRYAWLYSNFVDNRYSIGIQSEIGKN